MRALPFLLLAWIAMLAPAPASAQRFGGSAPVCMQKWEWGGSSSIYCEYRSFDECHAAAAGLSAMCLQNPYAQRPSYPDRSPRLR
ncbi:DUF3551 domain-containing protein [Bradyrhizobium sp. LB11.1]|jgi:hypothetical protein|uniref:DUF3551 domain-containing protein n=1 Tax=Bradyrhizobium sp. LB11.1 TaxID=3156326 RepID=UPI003391F327